MAFVGQLLGGGAPEKAQIDKGATTEQATQIYNQQQSAIQKQQAFADAVAGQNGLANQNQVYQQLAGIANGTGPSVAQNQLAQATQANVANQAALAAGVRGSSQNAGLIARQAAMAGANAQQQAAGQTATLRAQEQQNAIGQMGQLATNQVNQQQQALSGLSGATNQAQSNILGAINGQNTANVAATADYNKAMQAQTQAGMSAVSGLASGIATGGMSLAAPGKAAHGGMIPDQGRFVSAWNRHHGIKEAPGMMSDGGSVPGRPLVQGDSLKNDTQPMMLSPGEVVIPRSVMQSKDPVKAAGEFVKKVLAGKGPEPTMNDNSKMASGGLFTENPDLAKPPPPVPDYTSAGQAEQTPDWGKGIPEFNQPNPDDPSRFSKENMERQTAINQQGNGTGEMPINTSNSDQTPSTSQGGDAFGYGAMSDATMSGYRNAQAGIALQGQAEAQKARGESAAADAQIKGVQDMQSHYNTEFDKLNTERKGFQDALASGKIDPNHYLGSQSDGQRVTTAIGLILGGLAGGLNGTGGNPALDFLNKQIDRDIDSQKAEMGKKENLLKANMQQFGNLHDATMATKAMLTDAYAAKLTKAGADAGSDAAKARAMQAAGELQMKVAPMMQQTAMRKAMMSGGGTPEMKIRMMVPEGQQQTMFKQLGEAQTMIKGKDNVMSAFDKLDKTSTLGHTIASPLQSGRERDALIKPLVAQISKDYAGRFTETDAEYMESMFPSRGDSAKTVQLKRQQINSFLSSKMHFPELKAYGIDPQSGGRFDNSGQDKIKQRKIGE